MYFEKKKNIYIKAKMDMRLFNKREEYHSIPNPKVPKYFQEGKPFSIVSKLFLFYGIDIEFSNSSLRKTLILSSDFFR